ncbi:MAG: hypothetical protein ABEI77_08880 [Halorientalis sp.]
MVSVADIVGLLVIVGVNSTISALATRFFRVRLNTTWGSAIYTVLLLPVPLVAVVLVLGGIGLGPDLGTANAVLGVTIVLPMALGVSFDYFWMPAPDEVDVPDRTSRHRAR